LSAEPNDLLAHIALSDMYRTEMQIDLSNWHLQRALEIEPYNEAIQAEYREVFSLDVDEDVALILAQEGFSSLEEVAYVPEQEMLDIEEFDADIVAELRSRARDVLLTRAIASEEQLESAEPTQELLDMEGMTKELALSLASQGVTEVDDLAELAVDELVEMSELNDEAAAAMIMKARESWFADEQTEAGE
jgi:N utilization substance protein A